MKETELSYDKEISRLRAQGAETATAEAAKTLAILHEQLRIAQAKGEAGKLEAKIVQGQIDAFRASQGQARYEAAFQRRKNELAAAGDSAGVRAMEDYRERARMRDQYTAVGLTAAQADSDFRLQMRAEAAGANRVVTDSMQSIGGGGGYSGFNPAESARRRDAILNSIDTKMGRLVDSAGRGIE